jgi:polyhydroxybutyrate depolymerase
VRRLSLIATAVLAAALVLAGCTGPAPHPTPHFDTGTTEHTLTFDGLTRHYLVHVPAGLTPGPSTLVVMLHGGLGSAKQAEAAYGWDDQSETDEFIVAYPDGIGRTWNAGGCCGKAVKQKVDDVGFIQAMVAEIGRGIEIDPQRTFATGMSNGAIMAYRLACETDTFAAIAPVAGTVLVPCDKPKPVSVIAIHGLQDGSVPFDGSVGHGIETIDGPSVPDVMKLWRTADGCGAPGAQTTYGDDARVQAVENNCAGGTAVLLITIADAGHQWPGATKDSVAGDPPSTLLDATFEIAGFFAAHPRPVPPAG